MTVIEMEKLNEGAKFALNFYNNSVHFKTEQDLISSVIDLEKEMFKKYGLFDSFEIVKAIIISYDKNNNEFKAYFSLLLTLLKNKLD